MERDLDNAILELRTRSCDLCLYEDIGKYEIAYAKRTMSIQELIKSLKDKGVSASKYKWYTHIRLHVRPEVGAVLAENAPVLAQEVVDKIGECVSAIEDIQKQIDKTSQLLDNEVDTNLIKAYVSLQTETRHWIELLAKLTGEFKESTNFNVKNLHVEYNNVTGIVLQEACAICKPKLAAKLEPLILKKS